MRRSLLRLSKGSSGPKTFPFKIDMITDKQDIPGTITPREHSKQINHATYVLVVQCLLQYDVPTEAPYPKRTHMTQSFRPASEA